MATKTNEYAEELGPLLDECPKTVLAAIAVSALTAGGNYLEHAQVRIANEWQALHEAGIVPQAPKRHARSLINPDYDDDLTSLGD